MATAKQILDTARLYLGMTEYPANSNNVLFNTLYYGKAVSGSAYPWCCVFVWAVFYKANASKLFYGGKKTASCTTLMNYYKNQGQLVTGGTYLPGDIVFYQFDKDNYADHVGIIEEDGKGYIYAIEGNTSESGSQTNGGAVLRKKRNKSLIMAVARPKYDKEPEPAQKEDKTEMIVYKELKDIPEWGYETVSKLVDAKLLIGDGDGLNISYDLLRTLVILDRAGIFDKE